MNHEIEELMSAYFQLEDERQKPAKTLVEQSLEEQIRANVNHVIRAELRKPVAACSDVAPRTHAEISESSQLIVRRFHSEWEKLVAEASDHSMLRLRVLVAQLTERYGATSGWLFFKDGESLCAHVTHHSRQRGFLLSIDGRGIVPHVARTRAGYLTNDVDQDSVYLRVNDETKSELAVPIFDTDGQLLGVLNLESRLQGQFTQDQVRDLSQAVSCLVIHMLVIQRQQSCPYHPERHGWDLSFVLNRLCRAIAEALDEAEGTRFSDTAACTVWYGDHVKDVLFVFATSGFDVEYIADATLPMRSFTGHVSRFPRGEVEDTSPWDARDFRRLDRIEVSGVKRILATPIYLDGFDQPDQASATLNIYFLTERPENTVLSSESLASIAAELGVMISAYRMQRSRLARAYLQHQLHEVPQPAATSCEVIKDVLKTVLEASGCTVFTLGVGPLHNRRLYFATTTGIEKRSFRNGGTDLLTDEPFYDLDRDLGYTSFLAKNPGEAVRKNDVMNSREKGVPSNFPLLPLDKYREKFALSELDKRRFLGIGVEYGEKLLGVLRLNRASTSKPFTRCDQEVLESLADLEVCKRALIDFQKQQATRPPDRIAPRKGLVRAVTSFLRPVPNVGSSRTCVDELLQSLAVILAEHGIERAGVMLESLGNAAIRPRWYVCHQYGNSQSHNVNEELNCYQPWKFHLNRQTRDRGTHIFTYNRAADRNVDRDVYRPASAVRVPVIAWTGREYLKWMLALDFVKDIKWSVEDFELLFHATQRLSGILGTSDYVIRPEGLGAEPAQVLSELVALTQQHAGIGAEGTELRFRYESALEPVYTIGRPMPVSSELDWQIPDHVHVDQETRVFGTGMFPVFSSASDAALYGVKQLRDEPAYSIPLRLGPFAVGELRCLLKSSGDVESQLGELLRTIPGLWSRLNCELQTNIWDPIQFTPEKFDNGITRWNEEVKLRRLNFADSPTEYSSEELFARL